MSHNSHQSWCSKFPLRKARKLLNSNTASFFHMIYNSRYVIEPHFARSFTSQDISHSSRSRFLEKHCPGHWLMNTPLLICLHPNRSAHFSVVDSPHLLVDTCPFHGSKWSFLSLVSSIRASLLWWNIHTGHIPFYISTIHSFSNLIVKYKRKLTDHWNPKVNAYKFSAWNSSVASTETAHSPQLCGADFKVRI